MTIVVAGDAARVEQVRKQLDKIVEVVRIVDITNYDSVIRELALIKVKASHTTRSEIIQIVDIFRANIVDVSADSLVIEVTGDGEKVDSLMELLRGFGVREIARTGIIALTRGGVAPLLVEEDKVSKEPRGMAASKKAAASAPDW